MDSSNTRKRSRSASSPPWRRRNQRSFRSDNPQRNSSGDGSSLKHRKEQESFAKEQTRRNQVQEAVQMREWVSKEDEFVLRQAKKKAQIRVREGRAKPIDWLAVVLSVIDPTKDLLEDDSADADLDIKDPDGVIEGLSGKDLQDLEKDIDSYEILESNRSNKLYWNAMRVICQERRSRMITSGPSGRIVTSVSGDIDRLLGPKTLEQLGLLETQISHKLHSNETIDVEYWEQLLRNITVYKAKAELKNIYRSVIDSRLQALREQQKEEAEIAKEKLAQLLRTSEIVPDDTSQDSGLGSLASSRVTVQYSKAMDPEPLLKIRAEDKGLEVVEESDFLGKRLSERRKVLQIGYVPLHQRKQDISALAVVPKAVDSEPLSASRFTPSIHEDFSSATKALYEREVARGVQEDEEIFTGEEEVPTLSKPHWAGKYRPRKPRYFNRVQMGYEWNKYNQTHYDHDNPPPKVVQGYKFNVFYPDLIDKGKAPTYRIERENGRKRGQSFAPAGEEDTCLIRFISGPPYEDLAFRIVDKEWDYSAKRERGFRSSFDKGILQLHFQFKKVYYRK
ncbi:hypothetical protein MMC13_007897 [Lambiella insularis]|nr:hypothetical protein [Lambiella insularis]